jgi:hypothetical protein
MPAIVRDWCGERASLGGPIYRVFVSLTSTVSISMGYVLDSYFEVVAKALLMVNGVKNVEGWGFTYGSRGIIRSVRPNSPIRRIREFVGTYQRIGQFHRIGQFGAKLANSTIFHETGDNCLGV